MLRQIHFALMSLISSAVIAGCAADATSSAKAVGEGVSTTQQALSSSGYYRIYYSSSSRTTENEVGWKIRDCDGYGDYEGDTSLYYKETRWSCPDAPYPFPTITECSDCIIYTLSDGSQVTSCTLWVCS